MTPPNKSKTAQHDDPAWPDLEFDAADAPSARPADAPDDPAMLRDDASSDAPASGDFAGDASDGAAQVPDLGADGSADESARDGLLEGAGRIGAMGPSSDVAVRAAEMASRVAAQVMADDDLEARVDRLTVGDRPPRPGAKDAREEDAVLEPPKGRVPTGVALLDKMMQGGLPEKAQVLIQGPRFLGKEQMARMAVLAAAKHGIPAIMVVTQESFAEARDNLQALDPDVAKYEEAGNLWYVDCYCRTLGDEPAADNLRCTDSPGDLEGIAAAVQSLRDEHIDGPHVLMIDSVSDMVLHNDAARVFRFLQVFLGRSAHLAGTSLVLLDEGMHDPHEISMFKHLCQGALTFRGDPSKHQLRVEGLHLAANPGWIEYRFNDNMFRVTGSLCGGRIR